MSFRIEIKDKPGIFDSIGHGIKKDVLDLGIAGVESVSFSQIYNLSGSLSEDQARTIAAELLTDGVSQDHFINQAPGAQAPDSFVVEVAHNPGVMDPVEESTLKGIRDLGITTVTSVKTARKYVITGRLTPAALTTIAEKLLYNKLIQHVVDQAAAGRPSAAGGLDYKCKLATIDLLGAQDKELKEISRRGQLFLNIEEMRQIRGYFRKLGRNPTDCELETVAQTWSEHCMHKTFRGRIQYTEKTKSKKLKVKKIDNLLKSTIMKVTKELDKPWCISVFKDNAGVISFDDIYNVCFKVETHNHPSALEPFGGANTGIGALSGTRSARD